MPSLLMNTSSTWPVPALILLCALATASASELGARRGEPPSPAPSIGTAAGKDAAGEPEYIRRQWLAASPVGARDFCASSTMIDASGSAPPPRVECFHGSAAAQELQAYGWELTDVRTTIRKYSAGFEIEVMSAVAVKRECIEPLDPSSEASDFRASCLEASRGDRNRRGLFWQGAR